MRGWAIVLVVFVLGTGIWILEPWAPDLPELGDPGEDRPTQPGPTGEQKDLASLERARQSAPDRPRETTPKRSTIPVGIVAYAVDRDGRQGAHLDGFRLEVSDATGKLVTRSDRVDSGYELQLGRGSYVVRVTMADRVAPAPAALTITAASEPVILRFPLRAVEALLWLEVLDLTTKARVAKYRATIETHVGETEPEVRFVPTPESNPLPIPAARGQRLVVRVEAEGFAPGKPLEVAFDGSADRIERRVFLAPVMQFAGVEFHVTDARGAPIPRVIVRTETRRRDGSYEKLWRRRTEDEKGIYKLPDLAPASYRIELQAVDEAGLPTLHQPHRFEFPFTGNEHIREPVVLKRGGSIELRLTDARGNRIGKGVSIELTHPDGKVRESLWRPVVAGQPDPKAGLSADHLARDGHARLEPCVPEGLYTIKLRRDGGAALEESVFVRAGEVFALSRQLAK